MIIKRTLSILLSVAIVFAFTGTTFANAGADCQNCTLERPDSTGSQENINSAKRILYSSDDFKKEINNVSGKVQKGKAIINAPEGDELDVAFVTLPIENSSENLNNIVFIVNLETNEVTDVRKTFLTIVDDDHVNLKVVQNNEVISDLNITPDKVRDNLNSTDHTHEDYLKEAMKQQEEGDYQTSSKTCRQVVGILTGAAGAAQCYLLCLEIGFVNGMVGLGCAVMCSIALTVPLNEAVDRICK